jgi:hypothetical protein
MQRVNEMRLVLLHDFLKGRRVPRTGFPSSDANPRDCLAPLEQSSNHRLKSRIQEVAEDLRLNISHTKIAFFLSALVRDTGQALFRHPQ